MYLAIELDGNYTVWPNLTEEDYAELRAVMPTLPKEKGQWCPTHVTHFLTDENVKVLAKYGLCFQVSRDEASQGIGSMLVKLQDRIASLEMREKSNSELAAAGCAVQIAIPDLGLMTIDEVTWLEDACTERLQENLNDGWRILAVCPPNAQRRPDYILGRRKRERARID